ncbi:hypothetical protein D9M73_173140 [compost metagenome]
MPGMDAQPFAGAERLFDHLARQIEEHRARPGHTLQDEAFARKHPRAQALLKGDFERDRIFGAQEGFLAANQRFPGAQFARDDGAGEARRKGDMAGALRPIFGDKDAPARQRALQPREQPAAGVRIHRDAIAHPRHGVRLADDPFARRQIDRDSLHDGAGNLVAHRAILRQ